MSDYNIPKLSWDQRWACPTFLIKYEAMKLQARTEFASAINQIASEKGVEVEVILDAIQQAALAAYRKDLSYRNENIPDDFESLEAKIDSSSGEIGIYRGGENITPPGFARIAAQTAKQVIAQKLHEAEKGAILDEFEQKVGAIVSGAIQRQEGNTYFVDLGRVEGILPPSEQVRNEFYSLTQRMKFLIKEIREGARGPEVVVSRADPKLVEGLFAMEVPELQTGAVEIKVIAREAGGRTKVAVGSKQEGVDPVGSLVGQKGVRVQNVINELGDEKIDIISYSEDPGRFIAAALSPAKEVTVNLDEEQKIAKVKVPDNQLSLAIGKGGQNVRLAAKLTGWKIDIEGTAGAVREALGGDAVEAQIEEEIDQETEKQSLDGSTEPDVEELTRETEKAAADAEADIAQEDKQPEKEKLEEELGSEEETEDTQRGDLIGNREPSEAETAPVNTTETPGIQEEVQEDESPDAKEDENSK